MILDLDDTLFLERDYVLSGLRAVGEHVATTYGRTGFGDVAVALFEAGVRGDTFNRALVAVGLPDDEEFVALIHLGRPSTQPPAKERKPVDAYLEFLP